MGRSSRYTGFDVLAERDAWDAYTRSVVLQRLDPPRATWLTDHETKTLAVVAGHLLADERLPVLAHVVSTVDQRLQSGVGEGQRKPGVPPEDVLVRRGLAALDAVARSRHGHAFADCQTEGQFQIVAALQKGELESVPEFAGVPQQELFTKLLTLTVQAYASHPAVWSDMGYAGPAYPRGYYRLDRGVTDPWEPRPAPPHRGEDEVGSARQGRV